MEEVKHQGYSNVGGNSLTERFNTNNTEMNRRRFYEDNAQVFKARNYNNGFKPKGAKFVTKEISFSLTPEFEHLEDHNQL